MVLLLLEAVSRIITCRTCEKKPCEGFDALQNKIIPLICASHGLTWPQGGSSEFQNSRKLQGSLHALTTEPRDAAQ